MGFGQLGGQDENRRQTAVENLRQRCFRHGSDAGNRISRFAQLGTAGEWKSARDSVGRG
jgi:hypothetical protein